MFLTAGGIRTRIGRGSRDQGWLPVAVAAIVINMVRQAVCRAVMLAGTGRSPIRMPKFVVPAAGGKHEPGARSLLGSAGRVSGWATPKLIDSHDRRDGLGTCFTGLITWESRQKVARSTPISRFGAVG